MLNNRTSIFESKDEYVTRLKELTSSEELLLDSVPNNKSELNKWLSPFLFPLSNITENGIPIEDMELYNRYLTLINNFLIGEFIRDKFSFIGASEYIDHYRYDFSIEQECISQEQIQLNFYNILELNELPGTCIVAVDNNLLTFKFIKEVANYYSLGDILTCTNNSENSIPVLLGINSYDGSVIEEDLVRHVSINAIGPTASGKTRYMNQLVVQIVTRNSPENVVLMFFDPKGHIVNSAFNYLPHSLGHFTSVEELAKGIEALRDEVLFRKDVLAAVEVETWDDLRTKVESSGEELKLPYIILVMDQYSDTYDCLDASHKDMLYFIQSMSRICGIRFITVSQRYNDLSKRMFDIGGINVYLGPLESITEVLDVSTEYVKDIKNRPGDVAILSLNNNIYNIIAPITGIYNDNIYGEHIYAYCRALAYVWYHADPELPHFGSLSSFKNTDAIRRKISSDAEKGNFYGEFAKKISNEYHRLYKEHFINPYML